MIQKNITIPKTARYFMLGDPSGPVSTIWFVCHGYGQLASYFLEHFSVLEEEGTLIVAPEGLHRFYWEKFSGRVVASWMTREDREEDIKDYVNYLDEVYAEVLKPFERKKLKLNVLGFSQGAATVCRWLANKRSDADNLVLWAGGFPADLAEPELFNTMNLHLVTGDNDPFISPETIRKEEAALNERNVRYRHLRFSGRHEINKEMLLDLAKSL